MLLTNQYWLGVNGIEPEDFHPAATFLEEDPKREIASAAKRILFEPDKCPSE